MTFLGLQDLNGFDIVCGKLVWHWSSFHAVKVSAIGSRAFVKKRVCFLNGSKKLDLLVTGELRQVADSHSSLGNPSQSLRSVQATGHGKVQNVAMHALWACNTECSFASCESARTDCSPNRPVQTEVKLKRDIILADHPGQRSHADENRKGAWHCSFSIANNFGDLLGLLPLRHFTTSTSTSPTSSTRLCYTIFNEKARKGVSLRHMLICFGTPGKAWTCLDRWSIKTLSHLPRQHVTVGYLPNILDFTLCWIGRHNPSGCWCVSE